MACVTPAAHGEVRWEGSVRLAGRSSARDRCILTWCCYPNSSGHIAVSDGSEPEDLSQGGFPIHPVSRIFLRSVSVATSGYMIDEVRLVRPVLLLKIVLGHRVMQ